MKLNFMSTRFLRILVAAGYLLMCLLAGGIMYLWHYEWKEIEALETENQRINNFRQEIHHVYGEMTGLSLLGESVLEWEDEDLEHYHIRRMAVDSMLCRFKTIYPARQIDSVRHLLESKERLLHGIVEVLDEQESLNQRIAERVPVIAARSAQEQPQKSKRKGFLGLFGKKEKPKTTATTNMFHALNSKEIAQQQAQSRRLAAQTNSLAMRNNKLNRQLQSLIGQMDRKIESDLQGREMEITAMRERSFLQIGSLTGCLFLLLVVSYIIIHRDIRRIIRYKSKTVSLIKQLYESDMQNKELISSRKKAMHTITHELRTPLTAIHGYAELIQGHDTDNISRYAESILQAAGRMIAMLNTLLDFFRLDSGKENANSAPFRLQGMADALLTEFIPLAEAKDLRFTVECCDDVILMGDKERIMQVCGNLLSNAIKFTQSGNISLRMEYNGRVLSIVVKDTGSGMSEEEQQRVFGAFERLSNAATQDGFGLGLSIVKRIVDMLDGTIRLDSKKGRGCRFAIELPMLVADIVATEKKDKGDEPYFEHSYSVIVLDDNDILLSMVRDMYAHHGIRCDVCNNTDDLMEAIRSERYDMLITDLKMPETNGYEVLELLRSSDIGNSKTIPVVVATASGSCTEGELLSQGFSACLFKPFNLSELMAVSEKCLSPLLSDKEEQPDLTSLLVYGNKTAMLNKLITETEKDMQAIKEAGAMLDRKALDIQVHRLRSSWAVIRADKPLWELHRLLHSETECSDNEILRVVNAVLAMGNKIVEQAKTRKEDKQ
jgi:two-component system sensor histidine kinase EvgS